MCSRRSMFTGATKARAWCRFPLPTEAGDENQSVDNGGEKFEMLRQTELVIVRIMC